MSAKSSLASGQMAEDIRKIRKRCLMLRRARQMEEERKRNAIQSENAKEGVVSCHSATVRFRPLLSSRFAEPQTEPPFRSFSFRRASRTRVAPRAACWNGRSKCWMKTWTTPLGRTRSFRSTGRRPETAVGFRMRDHTVFNAHMENPANKWSMPTWSVVVGRLFVGVNGGATLFGVWGLVFLDGSPVCSCLGAQNAPICGVGQGITTRRRLVSAVTC